MIVLNDAFLTGSLSPAYLGHPWKLKPKITRVSILSVTVRKRAYFPLLTVLEWRTAIRWSKNDGKRSVEGSFFLPHLLPCGLLIRNYEKKEVTL